MSGSAGGYGGRSVIATAVLCNQPALQSEREDAVREVEVVRNRLDSEPTSTLGGDVRVDIARALSFAMSVEPKYGPRCRRSMIR